MGKEESRSIPGNQTTLDLRDLIVGVSYGVSVTALVGESEGDPVTVYIKPGETTSSWVQVRNSFPFDRVTVKSESVPMKEIGLDRTSLISVFGTGLGPNQGIWLCTWTAYWPRTCSRWLLGQKKQNSTHTDRGGTCKFLTKVPTKEQNETTALLLRGDSDNHYTSVNIFNLRFVGEIKDGWMNTKCLDCRLNRFLLCRAQVLDCGTRGEPQGPASLSFPLNCFKAQSKYTQLTL